MRDVNHRRCTTVVKEDKRRIPPSTVHETFPVICQSLSFPSQPSAATCLYLAHIVAVRRSGIFEEAIVFLRAFLA